MPLKSKSHRSRAQNLPKIQKKSYKATVEDEEVDQTQSATSRSQISAEIPLTPTPDHDLPDFIEIVGGFEDLELLPDQLDDLDDGSEPEDDEESDITEILALEHFMETLTKAQTTATAVERERDKANRRPKKYAGGSVRTKQRHKQIQRELKEKGFQSVAEMFTRKVLISGHHLHSDQVCQPCGPFHFCL